MDARARLVRRWQAVPELVVDALLAAALLAIALAEVSADGFSEDHIAFQIGLLTVQSAVLVFRRRYPVPVWIAEGVLVTIYGVGDFADPTLQYAPLVAVYTVAAHTSWRTAARAGVVTASTVALSMIIDPRDDFRDWLVAGLSTMTAWLLGNNVRTFRAYAGELQARAERLERDRDEQAHRAVAAERLRLARELHDVAAHHVSVIALHAEAGEGLLPDHPERAAAAFHTIGSAARSTMTDLRRVVGVLRDEADRTPPLAPQPGLDELAALVRDVEEAGLPVTVSVNGVARPVDHAVDTSAYRIVQEALTNVLRHAGAARAEVRIRYEPDALALEVLDDGKGADPHAAPGGHGLVGMRERVALFGGSFSAAPRPGGGSAVSARLPL